MTNNKVSEATNNQPNVWIVRIVHYDRALSDDRNVYENTFWHYSDIWTGWKLRVGIWGVLGNVVIVKYLNWKQSLESIILIILLVFLHFKRGKETIPELI